MRLFTKSPLMMAWSLVFIVTMVILPLYPIPIVPVSEAVQLIHPTPTSFDFIGDPFIFLTSLSLSSGFTFQIGNGVALVIIPHDLPSKFATNMSFEVLDTYQFLGVEFYANVCKISTSSRVISTISKNSNVFRDGVKLSSWIDYHATSKRIDVSVSLLDDPKPVEPLISHDIDLWEISKGEKVLLGLVSSNKTITSVYSWDMEIKDSQYKHWAIYTGFNSLGRSVLANQNWLWSVGYFIYVLCVVVCC